MLNSKDYCPACGGCPPHQGFLGHEHSDYSCSFRWVEGKWVPASQVYDSVDAEISENNEL